MLLLSIHNMFVWEVNDQNNYQNVRRVNRGNQHMRWAEKKQNIVAADNVGLIGIKIDLGWIKKEYTFLFHVINHISCSLFK